jgi:hypothetical protein
LCIYKIVMKFFLKEICCLYFFFKIIICERENVSLKIDKYFNTPRESLVLHTNIDL